LELYAAAHIQEAKHFLAQLKQKLVEISVDFQQTIVESTSNRPVEETKSTLTHTVICDAMLV